jgi:predicted dehydrogenase
VEKPITTLSDDAEGLIQLAQDRSRVLMVGHTFVYNGGIRKVKEYLNQGSDKVYYLYSRRTNLGPIRHDVSALWDLAPHDVAIFNFLLDSEPEWVSAVGAKVLHNCREDVGFISLGYPDNVVGHIHVSWADPHKAREVVVVGSDRRIVFNDMNGIEQVRVFEKGIRAVDAEPLTYGEYRLDIRDGDILSPRVDVGEPLKTQCRHFLECVATNAAPLTGGREGQRVVRVLEAVDRSLALHGAPVEVNRAGKDQVVEIAVIEGAQPGRSVGERRSARVGRRAADRLQPLNITPIEVPQREHYNHRPSA